LWRRGDQNVIDGFFVNGSAHLVERASRLLRAFQSGYIYHYAFAMLIGVFALVTWFARLN
jgi:NADH-quinone oxidoreductase subunit L